MFIKHPSWCICPACQQRIKDETAKIHAALERMNQEFAVLDVQSLVQERLNEDR